MHIFFHLESCLVITYVFLVMLGPVENASGIKIRPDSCTNAMGENGICMFVWECIKQDGRQLGPCVDRFLVGTCCGLPSEAENIVPGASLPLSSTPSDEDNEILNQIKPGESNIQLATVSFPSFGVTSATITIDSSVINTSSSVPASLKPISTSSTNFSSQNTAVSPSVKSTTVSSSGSPVRATTAAAESECGMRTQLSKVRVVGGTNAEFGDWPWQVSVRKTTFFGFASTHRCGGAILSVKWVITAAHCVDDIQTGQIRVRAGEFDFSSTQEPYPFQELSVQRKIVHPKYNFFTYENDLALLKLETKLQLQPHVKPICLPPKNDTFVGKNATVTGWGRLKEGGILPSILQQVQVPVINNTKCKDMFLKAGRHESIPDLFMCAGFEEGGRDSCQGDSGGPLQIKEGSRWVLAGVISWGIGCAEANMPGVCTRVTKFLDWIEKTMQTKR